MEGSLQRGARPRKCGPDRLRERSISLLAPMLSEITMRSIGGSRWIAGCMEAGVARAIGNVIWQRARSQAQG